MIAIPRPPVYFLDRSFPVFSTTFDGSTLSARLYLGGCHNGLEHEQHGVLDDLHAATTARPVSAATAATTAAAVDHAHALRHGPFKRVRAHADARPSPTPHLSLIHI